MNIPTYLSGQIQSKAYRVLRIHVTDSLAQYDLNPTQWSLLGVVFEARDGIRLAKVAHILGVKAPLITNMAKELIRRGLIKKVDHHSDARAKLLVIELKGKLVIERVEAALRQELGSLLKGVSQEDLNSYQKVLEAIIKNG